MSLHFSFALFLACTIRPDLECKCICRHPHMLSCIRQLSMPAVHLRLHHLRCIDMLFVFGGQPTVLMRHQPCCSRGTTTSSLRQNLHFTSSIVSLQRSICPRSPSIFEASPSISAKKSSFPFQFRETVDISDTARSRQKGQRLHSFSNDYI